MGVGVILKWCDWSLPEAGLEARRRLKPALPVDVYRFFASEQSFSCILILAALVRPDEGVHPMLHSRLLKSGSKNRIMVLVVLVLAGLGGLRTLVSTAAAAPKDPAQVAASELAAGEKQTLQLLNLLDRDHSGKVSKAEFMSFMEAEFDRLDKNSDGELDVKELGQTQVRVHAGVHR